MRRFRLAPLCLLAISLLLAACASDPMIEQKIAARRAQIASEPQGDWYIGRRFTIAKTQFWGYLRRPGQSWDDARLVMMNENVRNAPDRLPEIPTNEGNAHGFDHNHEYKIWGSFTGRTVYDPNSDLFLPEFRLTNWESISTSPGWLFKPNERFNGSQLLRYEKQDYP
ncbi:hypothetical protein DES53_109283 [Roseimicrobium gellanilyticum]|uniref:Lipoprotein n=1 Tax=Roseimicrobium gellanilyticum TaxID=748857 RepID=A0A366HDP8_9BACT|nr:hypothetical protein [Roseimicrobium gellanilyticum]RBP39855.1 hypothetical protein DES53_109283 [Roseimicrobium gellanilyticum]